MGHKERTETYLLNGRLVPIRNTRPSGRGRWRQCATDGERHLVAIVEGGAGDVSVTKRGPAATKQLVADSVAIHTDRNPANIDNSLWSALPAEVTDAVVQWTADASAIVAERWDRFSNEEAMTGTLFGSFPGTFSAGNWRVNTTVVEFSKQTKEPLAGADVAVVFDVVAHDGRRAVKTIWLQAKAAEHLPTDWHSLERLDGQIRTMRTFTPESFGVAYTKDGAFLIGPEYPKGYRLDIGFRDVLECRHGDKRLMVLAESLNRLRVFEVLIDESQRQPVLQSNNEQLVVAVAQL